MSTKQQSDSEYINGNTRHLLQMGWTSHFQAQLADSGSSQWLPARVIGVGKNVFRVSNGKREWSAAAAGRIKHQPDGFYPVTGDWVLSAGSVIYEVLARKNALSRGASGARGRKNEQARKEQVIAANLDAVFVVCGLDRDFNLRRIERYVTLIYNCGLNPVIVLTKADLHENPAHFATEAEAAALGVPTHLVSARDGTGLAPLETYLSLGRTAAMVGSSGAGKSTLVNRLYGETIRATASISGSVGKGKHTTSSRDLIVMPQGGMVIDNPGIREIAFWDDGGGLEGTFPDIEQYAEKCRFSDCSHSHEPGCRVLQAAAEGEISRGRLDSYRKMKRELAYLSDRKHKSADRVEKERWKEVALKVKAMKKKR
ncbi:MAG: ribosome small subunit-dependent GTPase A [Desulfobacterales bacterium]|nr:ribosome small subunit-dependent GTPase A [Desulfobacterales bacterium]